MDIEKFRDAGFDVDTALSFTGDEDVYEIALQTFVEDYDINRASIVDNFASKNIKDYTVAVHGLKSGCKMIGAMDLSNAALEMEMAGKADNWDLIESKTEILLSQFAEIKALIEMMLD